MIECIFIYNCDAYCTDQISLCCQVIIPNELRARRVEMSDLTDHQALRNDCKVELHFKCAAVVHPVRVTHPEVYRQEVVGCIVAFKHWPENGGRSSITILAPLATVVAKVTVNLSGALGTAEGSMLGGACTDPAVTIICVTGTVTATRVALGSMTAPCTCAASSSTHIFRLFVSTTKSSAIVNAPIAGKTIST